MNVPIDDRDAFDLPIVLLGITRSDCDIIEQAESHGALFCRMMSRWTHWNESVVHLTLHNQVDRLTRCACRMFRRVQRIHRDSRVCIEVTDAFANGSFDVFVELWRMCSLNVAARGFSRLHFNQTGP